MDEHKIEKFARSNPGATFPRFERLSPESAAEVGNEVARRVGIPANTPPDDFMKALRGMAVQLRGANAHSSAFDLLATLSRCMPPPPDDVLLNWHQFDDLDRISLRDLSAHLADIWYPKSDDIDIVDPQYRWVASIGYDGEVYFLELPRRPG